MPNDKGKGGPPQDVLNHLFDVHSKNGTLEKILDSGIGELFTDSSQTAALIGYAVPVGTEPWLFDGNELTLLADIYEGTTSSFPSPFTIYDNILYFYAWDENGDQLWSYSFETQDVVSITDDLEVNIYRGLIPFESGGLIYFDVGTNPYDVTLWAYDPENHHVSQVSETGVTGANIVDVNGNLYYQSYNLNLNSTEIWMYDTMTKETTQISDLGATSVNAASGNYIGLIEFNDEIIFMARTYDEGLEYRVIDTETNEVSILIDANPGSGSTPAGFSMGYIAAGDTLFLPGYSPETGQELMVYNQSTGTISLIDVNKGAAGSGTGLYNGLHIYDGNLYFTAVNEGTGYELWSMDLVTLEAAQLTNENGSNSFVHYDSELLFYEGKIYFSAITAEAGQELASYDIATGDITIFDFNEGPTSTAAKPLGVVNDTLVITANNVSQDLSGNLMYASEGHPETVDDFIHVTDESETFRSPFYFTVFDLDTVA